MGHPVGWLCEAVAGKAEEVGLVVSLQGMIGVEPCVGLFASAVGGKDCPGEGPVKTSSHHKDKRLQSGRDHCATLHMLWVWMTGCLLPCRRSGGRVTIWWARPL